MPLAVAVALTVKVLALAFDPFITMSTTLLVIATILVVVCAIAPSNTSQLPLKKSSWWVFALIPVALMVLFFYEATVSIQMAAMSFFSCLLILGATRSEQK